MVCWFMYAAWLSAFEELRNPVWRFVYSTHGYFISMLIATVEGGERFAGSVWQIPWFRFF
jgi:hypothetical protein